MEYLNLFVQLLWWMCWCKPMCRKRLPCSSLCMYHLPAQQLSWWYLSAGQCSGISLVLNLGVVDSCKKFPICLDFQPNFPNNSTFSRQKFLNDIFLVIYSKIFTFLFIQKNYHLQLHSGQIVLFLLKSHHFRTYSLGRSFNNISRPHIPKS